MTFRRKLYNRGYAGLVALLVTVAIIALLSTFVLRHSLGPTSSTEPDASTSNENKNAIQSAEEAKALIESRNAKLYSPDTGL